MYFLPGMWTKSIAMILKKNVGPYKMQYRIGSGRYGVCYLAENELRQQVVIKKFRKHIFKKNKDNNHFEAELLSSIQHHTIPKLLGIFNNRSGYFFVLEYKKGITIENLLFNCRKEYSDKEIYRIGSQLLEAISYLHKNQIIHGDISIANILDDETNVSLIDFGLARRVQDNIIEPQLDYACFGEILLYLLYSAFHGDGKRAWYDELPLDSRKKTYIKRLISDESFFSDINEVQYYFTEYFYN